MEDSRKQILNGSPKESKEVPFAVGGTSSSPPSRAELLRRQAECRQVLHLQAELVPASRAQQHALHDALRLLATWAVRAARAHAPESDPDGPPGRQETEQSQEESQ